MDAKNFLAPGVLCGEGRSLPKRGRQWGKQIEEGRERRRWVQQLQDGTPPGTHAPQPSAVLTRGCTVLDRSGVFVETNETAGGGEDGAMFGCI